MSPFLPFGHKKATFPYIYNITLAFATILDILHISFARSLAMTWPCHPQDGLHKQLPRATTTYGRTKTSLSFMHIFFTTIVVLQLPL
jgi:hypothetical protein